jgi:hypothetical protein
LSERRFGPTRQGERAGAVFLALGAAFTLYVVAWLDLLHMAPDPRWRGGAYGLLLAGVLMAGAVAMWRWTPFQAEIVVSDAGVFLKATGRAPQAPMQLPWEAILQIEHRLVPQGRTLLSVLVFVARREDGRPREHVIFQNGLEGRFADVVAAIGEAALRNGWQLVGPRVGHVGRWFHGMNWRLDRRNGPDAG